MKRTLSLIGGEAFDIAVSVPSVLEYEEVARRQARRMRLTYEDIDDILNYVCSAAARRQTFFLWRPFSRTQVMIWSWNWQSRLLQVYCDFQCSTLQRSRAIWVFGVTTPREFLNLIGRNK